MLYLREWRLARKLTLKELQEKCGIDFRVLSKYELAVIDPVSEKLTQIANALDIEEGDLFRKPLNVLPTEEVSHVS